jgi:hypothetical protein
MLSDVGHNERKRCHYSLSESTPNLIIIFSIQLATIPVNL